MLFVLLMEHITGKPEEVIEFGELVKMNTEIMLNQAYLMEQMEWKQRLKSYYRN